MAQLFEATSEEAYVYRPRFNASERLPLIGQRLDDKLRAILGIPEGENPSRIRIRHTSQDYLVSKGYLIPYYQRSNNRLVPEEPKQRADTANTSREKVDISEFFAHPRMDRDDRTRRDEELIIDRARSFVLNAEPQISALRTRGQIDNAIATYVQMPEDDFEQCAKKAARFKVLVGAILVRLEMLGRCINQRNTNGVMIEYPELANVSPIDDAWIKKLKKEYLGYCNLLGMSDTLLRVIAFSDERPDYDGVLIDFVREIAKPGFLGEEMVRNHILNKIGDAIGSIDEVHAVLIRAMCTKPTKALFEGSIQQFLNDNPYGVHTLDEVVGKVDEYTALCRARASTPSDSDDYDDIYARKDVLHKFFLGPNGLLESMRRVGRGSANDVDELRGMLKNGIKLMNRVSYTRIPCNHTAPEPWIPNLSDDASPMESFMAQSMLSMEERAYARSMLQIAASMKPASLTEDATDAQQAEFRERMTAYYRLLNESFSSYGHLQNDYATLKKTVQSRESYRG